MEKIKNHWLAFLLNETNVNWWQRKNELWEAQSGRIIQTRGTVNVHSILKYEYKYTIHYGIHLSYLTKQLKSFQTKLNIKRISCSRIQQKTKKQVFNNVTGAPERLRKGSGMAL